MAKRGRRGKSAIARAAAGIGRTFDDAANRIHHWRTQGDQIADDIRHAMNAGSEMLAALGHSADSTTKSVRKALGFGKSVTRRKSTMSAEGRARISAAQKKRWAAKKKADKKAEKTGTTKRGDKLGNG